MPLREGILSVVGKIIMRSDDIFIPHSWALLLIGTQKTVACVPMAAQTLAPCSPRVEAPWGLRAGTPFSPLFFSLTFSIEHI